MEDIAARILQIVATSKSLPMDAVTPASTFEALQIDSLDKINLTFEIEEAFHIAIPDESLSSLRTVQDVIDGVTRLKSQQSPVQPDGRAP